MSGTAIPTLDADARRAMAHSFAEDGFAILRDIIGPEILTMLREECAVALEQGGSGHFNPLLSRNGRVFAFDCQRRQPTLRKFIFSSLVAEICEATLGADAYFFLDQFVVKVPEIGAPFAWHQDSGYVVSYGGPREHRPFLSLWIPLDDTTAENGALVVKPGSHRRGLLSHYQTGETGEFSAAADGPERVIELAAGSIVAFSSLLLHATGENLSGAPRRVYLAQYTPEAMLNPGTAQLRRNAVPVLRDGQRATLG